MPRPIHTDVELLKIVGSRIRRAREREGLTQEKLAEILGIGSDTISRYETAAIPVSLTMLVRIAESLKVEASSLIPIQDDVVVGEGQEIATLWLSLDQQSRQIFLQLLRKFAG